MHVTAGPRQDPVVEARLWLRPGGRAGGSIPDDLPWIVEGRTTLAITSAALAADDSSGAVLTSDTTAPRHVVGFWDPNERSIALLRTRGPGDDTTRVQRGVALRVLETSPEGFRGTWHTAFWRPPLPSGYFCARRAGGE
jgi:hypothetical protein